MYLKLSKNKGLESEFIITKNTIAFGFKIEANHKTDHAGFLFEVSFFSAYFYINIYDGRHWDKDKDDWAVIND